MFNRDFYPTPKEVIDQMLLGVNHFEFKDENVWRAFNTEVAKIKGWQLPKQRSTKSKTTNSN